MLLNNVRDQIHSMPSTLYVYSDGGARGNPGPAAAAFMVLSEDGSILMVCSKFLGFRTNNQAEYEALIDALEHVLTLKPSTVNCYLDSELAVKQLTGEYAVRKSELKRLWEKVQALRQRFKSVNFKHVPRDNPYIQRVDSLVNETLDKQQ